MEELKAIICAARRRLEGEIARIENEIARLSLSHGALDDTWESLPESCNEVSRIMPADDTFSVESFRTADTPQDFRRHVGDSCNSPQHSPAVFTLPTPPTPSTQPLKVPFPPFSSENIEMWFWAMEKWFAGTNTIDDTHQFSAILLALPMATASVFKDQLDNPPSTYKYLFAKNLIIRHYSKNQFDRIKTLMDHVELGDAKPSELYAQMKQVAGDVMSHSTLKGLWIMRLPEQWRPSLALTSNDPLDFLHAADLMHQVTPRSNICSVKPMPDVSVQVQEDIQPHPQLCAINNGKSFPNNRPYRRSNRRSFGFSQPSSGSLCFYHRNFGPNARRCEKPCNWKPKLPPADN